MSEANIPYLIAGPILRKATPSELVFWLVTREPIRGYISINDAAVHEPITSFDLDAVQPVQLGEKCFLTLVQLKGNFPANIALSYEFHTQEGDLSKLYPSLCYPGESLPTFKISTSANYILHGSCRNPHHPSKDALISADLKVAQLDLESRPDLLMMSGDQIYADHVAGPTLDAIHQTIDLLGLYNEEFDHAPVANSQELYTHPHCYYGRDKLLPHTKSSDGVLAKLFPSTSAPIFSSREAENHLVSLAEFIAMYLLVWSPTLWEQLNLSRLLDKGFSHGGQKLTPQWQQVWREEKLIIEEFVAGLPNVQRLFAHIPTYMIFDDHDVTDDWNLTIGWEKAAYSNPFSKRIIGNGLIAYWLFQGWGNEPDNFNPEFLALAQDYFHTPTANKQDQFIDYLYRFERWHYTIPTSPKVVVLDTRTRRWRSESRMNKPSGLMDWEALIEFQQELMHQDKVVVVSAAPMFGVKVIEAMQKGMTTLGQPLLIDAENWMAHPGSANTLLSIFTHTKTPSNFVILSGDVHYSFAYDIKLRFRKSSPNIYQITCSGFKNQFPEPLLACCDHADRLLYSPRSPLNFFTKRKRLKVSKRDPDSKGVRRLVNTSAIGELKLDQHGKPSQISILTGDNKRVDFPPIKS